MRWVGRVSYSIYLWQQLFLVPNTEQRPLHVLQAFPFNLIAVFACATLSYYLLERRMIGLGHRWSSGGEAKAFDQVRARPAADELSRVMS